jgi:hypothetical protein
MDTADLAQLQKTREQMYTFGMAVDAAPAVLYFLTRRMGDKDVSDMQRTVPRKDLVHRWKHIEDDAKELARKLTGKEAGTPSRTWELLSKSKPEAILFLDLTARQQAVEHKIKNFFGKWRQVKDRLPVPEMAELRITPEHPEWARLNHEIFLGMLDGKMRSHTEITKFLKPFSPPPPPPPPPPPAKRGRGAKTAEPPKAAAAGGTVQAGKRGRKPKEAAVPAPAPVAAPVKPEVKHVVEAKHPAKVPEPAPKAAPKFAPKVAARPVKKATPAKKAAPKPAAKKATKPAKKVSKKK